MSSQLLSIALILHITGIIMMAGTTLADFAAFRQISKYLRRERDKGFMMLEATSRFSALLGGGGALLLLTGVTMVAVLHGTVAEQLWFRIKMGLVLLIILNGVLVARPAAAKLRRLGSEGGTDGEIGAIGGRLNGFYLSQLTMFLIVVTLSIFRFD